MADTSGCVSVRSPHLQVVSLSAIRKWELSSLDIQNAFLLAGGFDRDVSLHTPAESVPTCTTRVWELMAPTYGFNDPLVAFHRSLERQLLNSELSTKREGLRRQASAFDPCLFFVFRGHGQAVGAFATHIDDILGFGEPDILDKLRHFSGKRIGALKLQEGKFAHVGMELVQDSTFSVALTQGSLQPLGTSPQLWAARQKVLSPEDVKLQ